MTENKEFIHQRIIQELLEKNFDREDIDRALELMFSGLDIIGENIINSEGIYNRVFTSIEKVYLPVEMQGLIWRLNVLNILTHNESETLINRVIQNSSYGYSETSDIWDVLEEVVDDRIKLEIISQKIPEFKEYFRADSNFIN